MSLKLTIYKDDTLCEVSRVVEADKLKIPYKVSMNIIQSLDNLKLSSDEDIINFVAKNVDKMDKIIRPTFKISESELECIDTFELVEMAKELYVWAIQNVNRLKGDSKNVPTTE